LIFTSKNFWQNLFVIFFLISLSYFCFLFECVNNKNKYGSLYCKQTKTMLEHAIYWSGRSNPVASRPTKSVRYQAYTNFSSNYLFARLLICPIINFFLFKKFSFLGSVRKTRLLHIMAIVLIALRPNQYPGLNYHLYNKLKWLLCFLCTQKYAFLLRNIWDWQYFDLN